MSTDRGAALVALAADLADEVAALDGVVAPLSADELRLATPSPGWTVADQLGHLAAFDEAATRAAVDPEGFRAEVAALAAAGADPVSDAVEAARARPAEDVRAWWRAAAARTAEVAADLDPDRRLPWYGPDMGARSFLTARLMETWAHGQDVRDALGLRPSAGPRLRHVVDLGVRARPYSYRVHGMEDPGTPVRVEAVAPDGSRWAWGPAGAADAVRGTALDLALLLTQRRHLDDLDVEVVGAEALRWTAVAQAFAGPAGRGRPPTGRR